MVLPSRPRNGRHRDRHRRLKHTSVQDHGHRVVHTGPTPSARFRHAEVMGKKKRNHAKRPRPSGGAHRRPGGQNRSCPEPLPGPLTRASPSETRADSYDQGSNAVVQLQVIVGLTPSAASMHISARCRRPSASVTRTAGGRQPTKPPRSFRSVIGLRSPRARPLYLPGSSGAVTGRARSLCRGHGRSSPGPVRPRAADILSGRARPFLAVHQGDRTDCRRRSYGWLFASPGAEVVSRGGESGHLTSGPPYRARTGSGRRCAGAGRTPYPPVPRAALRRRRRCCGRRRTGASQPSPGDHRCLRN